MHPDVVAFDLDGTLTVRDCVVPFLVRTGGSVRAARAAVTVVPSMSGAGGTDRRDNLKRHVVRTCLRGISEERVRDEGMRFARRLVSGWMRDDTVRRLRAHQEAGDVVIIVSASLEPYVQPLGEMMEVDAVLATELEFSNGLASGELRGENCRCAEKVRRLKEWAGEAGFHGDSWLARAYGDSSGDADMLALARSGVIVRRREVSR